MENDSANVEATVGYQSGTLTITVAEARGLSIKDTSTKSSDPFVKLRLGDHTEKTETRKKTLEPKWNQDFTFDVSSSFEKIHIEVRDWDRFSDNDLIGEVILPLRRFQGVNEPLDCWYKLKLTSDDTSDSDESVGEIRLVTFFDVKETISEEQKDLTTSEDQLIADHEHLTKKHEYLGEEHTKFSTEHDTVSDMTRGSTNIEVSHHSSENFSNISVEEECPQSSDDRAPRVVGDHEMSHEADNGNDASEQALEISSDSKSQDTETISSSPSSETKSGGGESRDLNVSSVLGSSDSLRNDQQLQKSVLGDSYSDTSTAQNAQNDGSSVSGLDKNVVEAIEDVEATSSTDSQIPIASIDMKPDGDVTANECESDTKTYDGGVVDKSSDDTDFKQGSGTPNDSKASSCEQEALDSAGAAPVKSTVTVEVGVLLQEDELSSESGNGEQIQETDLKADCQQMDPNGANHDENKTLERDETSDVGQRLGCDKNISTENDEVEVLALELNNSGMSDLSEASDANVSSVVEADTVITGNRPDPSLVPEGESHIDAGEHVEVAPEVALDSVPVPERPENTEVPDVKLDYQASCKSFSQDSEPCQSELEIIGCENAFIQRDNETQGSEPPESTNDLDTTGEVLHGENEAPLVEVIPEDNSVSCDVPDKANADDLDVGCGKEVAVDITNATRINEDPAHDGSHTSDEESASVNLDTANSAEHISEEDMVLSSNSILSTDREMGDESCDATLTLQTEVASGYEVARLQSLFDLFERDNSECISAAEIITSLRALGFNPSKAEVSRLIAKHHVEDRVDFTLFSEMICKFVPEMRPDVSDALKAFEGTDHKVNLEDFRRIMMTQGEPLTSDECSHLLEHVQAADNGSISFTDFADALLNSSLRKSPAIF